MNYRHCVGVAFRLAAFAAIIVLLVYVLQQSDHGRSKGTPVPFPNLVACLVLALVAAIVTRRCWSVIFVPFVAGIAGSFGTFDQFCGPYGAVVGLLVGSLVAVIPAGSIPRLSKRSN